MGLSDKAIQEYKDIFKKEFDQNLTDEEAREQGERLLSFFKILIEIDSRTRSIRSVKKTPVKNK